MFVVSCAINTTRAPKMITAGLPMRAIRTTGSQIASPKMMAVALVIFARWKPVQCLYASLLFGGAQAIGPALQAVGVTGGYYLWNASPYILTLLVMVLTCSPKRTLVGAPGALGAQS